MEVRAVPERSKDTSGRARKARAVIGAQWIPFKLSAGRRKSLRPQCYLCFVQWQASNYDDALIEWIMKEFGLDVALVFGMALAVGDAYAGEDEKAAEDLG